MKKRSMFLYTFLLTAGLSLSCANVGSDGHGYVKGNVPGYTCTVSAAEEAAPAEPLSVTLDDGEYAIDVDLVGGSGKSAITSPTVLTVQDGKTYAKIEWSSSNYDYMIVGTEKYLNENELEEGRSTFTIPVTVMDSAMTVIADTTAMGTPHEIEYALTFYSDSVGPKSELPQEAAKRVVAIALVIIIGGGILNHFVNKKRRV